MIHEKIQKKKKRKMLKKKVIILNNNLNRIFGPKNVEIWFFPFFGKVVKNWISFQKTPIPNQFKFWAESYRQNTKQVQKITQI